MKLKTVAGSNFQNEAFGIEARGLETRLEGAYSQTRLPTSWTHAFFPGPVGKGSPFPNVVCFWVGGCRACLRCQPRRFSWELPLAKSRCFACCAWVEITVWKPRAFIDKVPVFPFECGNQGELRGRELGLPSLTRKFKGSEPSNVLLSKSQPANSSSFVHWKRPSCLQLCIVNAYFQWIISRTCCGLQGTA